MSTTVREAATRRGERMPILHGGSTGERIVRELLAQAGVRVNGDAPHDIQIHDERVFGRVLGHGDLGMGESYMDGWWDCEAIDQLLDRILRAGLDHRVHPGLRTAAEYVAARVINFQSRSRATAVAEQHYNIHPDVYAAMLDARRTYSCGYWREADTLDQAQEAKLELVCRKIGLKPGMSVLDIGCGWGSFAKYAAEYHGARVTATNIADEQLEVARESCAGLPVEFRREDYRDTRGQFDAVVSIGMFEHVGAKNHREYMEVVRRCLKPDGIALIHAIGANESTSLGGAWTRKYIFPNGHIPSLAQVGRATEGLLVVEDVHNFGPYYDRTLLEWCRRFEAAWPQLSQHHDERFHRMWRYYLLGSAAGFRSRRLQLCQFVLTRTGRAQPDARVV